MATNASGNTRPIREAGDPLLLATGLLEQGSWAKTFMRSLSTYTHPRERDRERGARKSRRVEGRDGQK